MIDSCRPPESECGLMVTYSKPSGFNTSIMKSDPCFSSLVISTKVGASVCAGAAVAERSAWWALRACEPADEAPGGAAPFKKLRRSSEPFSCSMTAPELLDLRVGHRPRCGLSTGLEVPQHRQGVAADTQN